MLHQQSASGPTLAIVAHGAQNLVDVETLGKQDPYFQFSLDVNNPKSFQKSFVHKDGGKTPTWNQSFSVPLAGEPEIFIEIMDEETTADAIIAFAAIPINQVVHAPGGSLNAIFDVFTPAGKPAGEVNLTLSAYNVPGQNTGYVAQGATPVKGTSHINEAHQKRVKSLKTREQAADAGQAAFGGLLAVGAGLLVNKLVTDNKKEEEAKKEAERQAQAERERHDAEKKRFEEERASFAQQQATFNQQQQHHQGQPQFQQPIIHGQSSGHHGGSSEHYDKDYKKKDKKDKSYKKDKKHHSGSDSDSSSGSDSDDGHKKKNKGDKKHWNPTGTYSTGDKVKFNGRKYICLQSHTSNPTWEPTQAHSLWRSD